jgi:hypothetical protein
MKKTIISYIICLWSISLFGQTTFSIEGGHLNIDQSVSLVVENTTWKNDGNVTADSGTVFFVDGTTVTGQSPTAFYILKVDNASNDLGIFQNTSVNHQLELMNGKIQLNDFQLELADGASFIGIDENNYIQINGNGQLIQTVGNTPSLFPIGATTFNPAYISNNTTSSRIGLVVRDTAATKSVNRVWELDNLDGNAIDAAISLLWDNQLTDTDFNATESRIIDLNNNNSFTPVFTTAQMSLDFPMLDVQVQDSITQSSIFTVSSDFLSSSNQVIANHLIRVFPNPATDFIQIESKNWINDIIQIFNVNGQLLKTLPFNHSIIQIDVQDLPSGTYFIKIGQTVKRILIKK